MSELEAMGISVQRGFVDGDNPATQLGFTLPRAIELQVTFSKEGFTDKLAKIFTRELQTGDETFDKTVYVKTETPELAAKLLATTGVRDAIARMIDAGGLISVDGPFVQMEIAGRHDNEDADIVTFVRALLAS